MPESADITVSQLLQEKVRLDDELARRQQAITVLFVDIVGSTRFYDLYGDVAGLTMVQKFLNQLIPVIEEHGGFVVKEIGDAVLARFQRAVDGVRSALHMQLLLMDYNCTRPAVEQIRIRVALNSGYALIKGKDVFGDVVNVCSRIESKAKPDDILISPSVYEEIRHVEEFAVRKRAEGVELKGKTEKLDLYEVVWQADVPPKSSPPPPSQSQVAMAAAVEPGDVEPPEAQPIPGNAKPAVPAVPSGPWRRVKLVWVGGGLLFIFALLAGGYYVLLRRPYEVLGRNLKITRLTQNGKAMRVALSPDGRFVVYVLREGEQQSLNVRNVGTGSDVRVLAPEVVEFSGIRFSPDGNYIYYARSAKSNPNYSDLYRIPVLGGSEIHLLRDIDTEVSFSPDGKQFAFVRGIPANHEIEVVIAASDGTGERPLLRQRASTFFETMFAPAWSPDGKTIALTIRESGNPWHSSIATVDVASRKSRNIFSTTDPAGALQWRPDSRSVVVPIQDSSQGLRGQLWQISVPEGKAAHITNDLTDYELCCLDTTRNGDALAVIEQVVVSNLWIWQEGGEPRQITSGGPSAFALSWTASDEIVFNEDSGALSIIQPNGENRRVLSTASNASFWPSACGDGRIVFSAVRNGKINLWRVEADGSNLTQVTDTDFAGRPQCSPDGKWVVYVGNDSVGWRVPSEGGAPRRLLDRVSNRRMSISRDGKSVAYIAMPATISGPNVLRVVDADNGAEEHRFDLPIGATELEWAPGGTALDFLLTRNGVSNLWRQPLSGGTPLQVTHFDSGIIFHYAWSREGKRLACARGSASSDIILMENRP